MHKKLIITLTLISLMTFVAPISVAAKSKSALQAQAVGPFIDSQTFAVARVDMTKLNIDAIVDKFLTVASDFIGEDDIKMMPEQLGEFRQEAKQRIEKFTRAGAKEIYAVFSISDFPFFFIVIPISSGADTKDLEDIIESIGGKFHNDPFEAFERKGGVLLAGRKETIDRLRTMPSSASRPELADALAAAGDATVQLAIIPTADQRRIIEEMLPTIQTKITGEVPGATFSRGLIWAAAGIDGPPEMSLKLTVQSKDNGAANDINNVINNLYNFIRQEPQVRSFLPDIDKLLVMLRPTVTNDRLLLTLNNQQADTIIRNILTPVLIEARGAAKRVMCAKQLKGIGLAIMIYANEHKGQFPPDLETLIKTADMPPKGLVCPATCDKDSYVYRGADLNDKANPRMILVHDKLQNHKGQGRWVVFIDGHVGWLLEKEFQESVKLDNKIRKSAKLAEKPAL